MATRRLATILSIDVVGYSRLMQSDASGVLAALSTLFRNVVQPRCAAQGGRVVKLMGDGALLEFPSCHGGILCAIDIQTENVAQNQNGLYSEPIGLRIGLHVGDVISEGDDVFGNCVNIASRLQAMAPAGGIFLSKSVADMCAEELPNRLVGEGVHSLKNIAKPVEVMSVQLLSAAERPHQHEDLTEPDIRLCKAPDGTRLAWTRNGNGPKLVKVANWISHLELDWRNPGTGHLLSSLGQAFEVIRYDSRGNGMSDWDSKDISFDRFVDDLEAIFDESSIDRAPLLALSQGCAVAVAFAARHPERVSGIAMIGGFPQGRAKRKSAKDLERAKAIQNMMTAAWDDETVSLRDMMAELIVPLASIEDRRQFAIDMLEMISPENMGRIRSVIDDIDIVDLLPKVACPCLVVHGRSERMHPVEQSRLMASELRDSRFIALDTPNHVITANDPSWPKLE
jgi:class 3 adenylate cyclase/pimeloyl-ACP methyl ester carboxylesterase